MENNINMNAPKKEGAGAIVGAVIIIIVLIVGGMYVYGRAKDSRMNDEQMAPMDNDSSYGGTTVNSNTTIDQSSQSNSDDLDSIDKDLNDTDLNSLDQ